MKDNKKGISPKEISAVKEKISAYYTNETSFTLIFYKGKTKTEKTCKVCGIYPSMFRVKTQTETISINYVDLLIGYILFSE